MEKVIEIASGFCYAGRDLISMYNSCNCTILLTLKLPSTFYLFRYIVKRGQPKLINYPSKAKSNIEHENKLNQVWTSSAPIKKCADQKVRQSKHAHIQNCNNPNIQLSKTTPIQNVQWSKHVLIQTWADPNVRWSKHVLIQMCANPNVHQFESNHATIKCVPDIWKKSAFSSTARVYGKPLTLNSKEAPGHADHEMEVRTKTLTFLWLSLSIWRLYKFHHITT